MHSVYTDVFLPKEKFLPDIAEHLTMFASCINALAQNQ